MCKRVPSPPQETTKSTSFSCDSQSLLPSSTNEQRSWIEECDLSRECIPEAPINFAFGNDFLNHLRCELEINCFMKSKEYRRIGGKLECTIHFQQQSASPGPSFSEKMETFPQDSPFESFKISSHDPMRMVQNDRPICEGCKKSSKYFCYRCVRMVEALEEKIPQVALPISMRILKHQQELDSKSTAIHAKLLAPTQISIHHFHKRPEPSGEANTLSNSSSSSNDGNDLLTREILAEPESFVILFPDEEAVELKDLSCAEIAAVKNVIVIDGTWSQAAAINRAEPYCRLKKIRIRPGWKTVFWRYQNLGDHCLSTIEAMYYFIREFAEAVAVESYIYDGGFDNLLYFYSFFYHLIQNSYIENPQRPFTSRHRSDYIKNRHL